MNFYPPPPPPPNPHQPMVNPQQFYQNFYHGRPPGPPGPNFGGPPYGNFVSFDFRWVFFTIKCVIKKSIILPQSDWQFAGTDISLLVIFCKNSYRASTFSVFTCPYEQADLLNYLAHVLIVNCPYTQKYASNSSNVKGKWFSNDLIYDKQYMTYVITYFGQVKNYVGQVKIILYYLLVW